MGRVVGHILQRELAHAVKSTTIARMLRCVVIISLFLATACENGRAQKPAPTQPLAAMGNVAEPVADSKPAPPPEPVVELADAPTVDLLKNRHRWHLYADGLVIDFATEGLWKYTQDYSRPFGAVVEHDGRAGRVVKRSATELTFPWHDDKAATLRISLHGAHAKQTIEVRLNGKRVGVVSVGNEWDDKLLEVNAGVLRDGENELDLRARSAGRVGDQKTYGLLSSVEVVTGSVGLSERPRIGLGQAVTVGGVARPALRGYEKMSMWVEIPPTAWLHVATGAEIATNYRVTAQTFDGKPRPLLDTTSPAGEWVDRRVNLADFAGRLIRLDLQTDGGAWAAPRVALEATEPRGRPAPYDNAILLVVDALRSDRLALYGTTRVQTPRTTAEGARAVVFRHNQAASPSSPPSHTSIHTGMIPRVHGVAGDRGQLNANTPMISSVARAAGIATAYYGNNQFGMARSRTAANWTEYHYVQGEGKGGDCSAIVAGVLDFAERQKKAEQRFFISALPFEPHTPYRYHEGITEKYLTGPWESGRVKKSVDARLISPLNEGKFTLTETEDAQFKALYDGEVEHWDGCFGALIDGLAERGLKSSTAIVLTSDHGEGMYEHGRGGHAWGHYAELSDVPFVIFADGLVDAGPANIDTVTGHIDIAPTVLDLLGVDAAPQMQGESVLPIALRGGPWTPRATSGEYGRSYSIRALRHKLIVQYDGTQMLFDLVADPGEQDDLVAKRPFTLRYTRELAGFFLEHRSDWKAPTWGNFANHARP